MSVAYSCRLRQEILSTGGSMHYAYKDIVLGFIPWVGLRLRNHGVFAEPIRDISYDLERQRFDIELEQLDMFHYARDNTVTEQEKKDYIVAVNDRLKAFGFHHGDAEGGTA